jgi:hypothetical protein
MMAARDRASARTAVVRTLGRRPADHALPAPTRSPHNRALWSSGPGASRRRSRGVYLPGDALHRWMRKAFTSPEFAADPTAFRYLAWTNRRLAVVDARPALWRGGGFDDAVRAARALSRARNRRARDDNRHDQPEPMVAAIV